MKFDFSLRRLADEYLNDWELGDEAKAAVVHAASELSSQSVEEDGEVSSGEDAGQENRNDVARERVRTDAEQRMKLNANVYT